jgi:hypothetical protein
MAVARGGRRVILALAIPSAKGAAAAWASASADPRGIVAGFTRAPWDERRSAALMAAAVVNLLCCAWLSLPASRGRNPELAYTGMTFATAGALEFKWLSATKLHFVIGATLAAIGIILAVLPARAAARSGGLIQALWPGLLAVIDRA